MKLRPKRKMPVSRKWEEDDYIVNESCTWNRNQHGEKVFVSTPLIRAKFWVFLREDKNKKKTKRQLKSIENLWGVSSEGEGDV